MPNKKIKLSKINEKAVNDFEKHLIADGIDNLDTKRTYTSACKIIFDITKKNWNKLTKKDIDKAFSSDRLKPTTRELYKMKFVKFLYYKKRKDLAEYIKTLFNFKILQQPTKTIDDILTENEIKQLVNSANNLRDKALMEIFLTTGGRREEIDLLKYKDMEITESIIWVSINNSKTKPRRIPIVANKEIITAMYPENLINFYNTHIFKNDIEKPLFYSHYKRRWGQPLNKNSINEIIRIIVKRSKINKHITPHILRHTSATYDGYYLTEQDLKLKYAFGKEQVKRYCHMTEGHLGDHLLKLAGITQEQIKNDSICPQCKNKVNINEKICPICKYILDREEQRKHIEKLEKDRKDNIGLKLSVSKLVKEIGKLKQDFSKAERKIKELKRAFKLISPVFTPEQIMHFALLINYFEDKVKDLTKEEREEFSKKENLEKISKEFMKKYKIENKPINPDYKLSEI